MTDDHIGDAEFAQRVAACYRRVGDPLLDARMTELLTWSEEIEDEAIRQGYPVATCEDDLRSGPCGPSRAPRGDDLEIHSRRREDD